MAGRPLARIVVVTALLVLAISERVAHARDCREETSLPADVKLVAPGPDVPPEAARFAGAWSGPWTGIRTGDRSCGTLVVEEVLPSGHARVIYSRGAWEPLKIAFPRYWRVTGHIFAGVLEFALPTFDRPPMVYQFTDAGLSGTFRGDGTHKAKRVADIATIACRARATRDVTAPSPSSVRDRLTAAELLASSPGAGPVHNDHFMPIGPVLPARHTLRGRLTVSAGTMASARDGCLGLSVPTPAFTTDLVTHGEHLVPVARGILGSPATIILSPGRVWSEPGDHGMSRASFPFVLSHEQGNAAYNGTATFLFDDTRVTDLRFQIVQETAPKGDLTDYWGAMPAAYTAGAVADEAVVRARFDEEIRRHVPIRPWSALPAAVRDAGLGGVDGEVPTESVSASGLVVDGVLYLRGCNTRYGPFPYCRDMRHGVFSVTKSLAGAVSLLRLAQKYGDTVLDAKVADYLTVTARHDGWAKVTFRDALNMATGIGESSPQREPNDPHADEMKPRQFAWARKRSAKERLDAAFDYPKYPWGPGEVFRYNSVHTHVLAAAMDAYLKRREGPNAHLWDMVVREVFEPIGILHAPKVHTLERGGRHGIPLLGYGFYPTVDDVAKLATLLQSGGRHEGRPILSAAKIADALYRTSPDGGLPIGWKYRAGAARYHLSFWSVPYRTSAGCFVQVPYMAGLGGNHVVVLSNGVTVFRFADAESYDVEGMILAGEALRPLCTPVVAAVTAPPPAPLSARELRAELVGRTFEANRLHLTIDGRGVVIGESGGQYDVGRWHITDDGQYCRAWNVWDRARTRCYRVYRDGDGLEMHPVDRWNVTRLRRVSP